MTTTRTQRAGSADRHHDRCREGWCRMSAIASAVRERPIIFSGEMVRAILNGRKTQTRRVVVPQPLPIVTGWSQRDDVFKPLLNIQGLNAFDNECVRCPFGSAGDRLWVRETWSAPDACECVETCHTPAHVHYIADGSGYEGARHNRIRSPIHMPRWASRLTLEVTGVRIERVQDISEDDAKAEGVGRKSWPEDITVDDAVLGHECGYFSSRSYTAGFARAWSLLNAKRGYGWDQNPWVWVVEFKRVTP